MPYAPDQYGPAVMNAMMMAQRGPTAMSPFQAPGMTIPRQRYGAAGPQGPAVRMPGMDGQQQGQGGQQGLLGGAGGQGMGQGMGAMGGLLGQFWGGDPKQQDYGSRIDGDGPGLKGFFGMGGGSSGGYSSGPTYDTASMYQPGYMPRGGLY